METDTTASPLRSRARAWRDADPDPGTRAELEDLLARVETGDGSALEDLADRFSGRLTFGTAGLRGALGAGPNRMNRAVVIRAAAGLAAYLEGRTGSSRAPSDGSRGMRPLVVVGFDARRGSARFAEDTAAVVVAAGGRAAVLPGPLPTPVLAFAIRDLGADAGVMVTASHNPRQDNGYKVYLDDGVQIVPPADADIAAAIDAVGPAVDVPRAVSGWDLLGPDVHERYLDAVAGLVRPGGSGGARELGVVHTALHGVGSDTVARAFTRAGFAAPVPVPTQAEPDPDFPTVTFPNPEEPGAMDAALDLAREVGPDLVLATDPDADRCAVAVPDPGSEGGWRVLRGDELGVLLGAHVLARGVPPRARFASSIVSSRMLATVCAAHGVEHVETLTGFKWIARVERLAYGYEEALGYCVAPDVVRDKDGVSAALLVAELAAGLRARGRTLLDALDDLHAEHGVHATDGYSVRAEDPATTRATLDRLRESPPAELGGTAVTECDDLAAGAGGLPPTDGVRWLLADGSRVVVRPSGTEPKLKAYLEVVLPPTGPDGLAAARDRAAGRLAALRAACERLTAPGATA